MTDDAEVPERNRADGRSAPRPARGPRQLSPSRPWTQAPGGPAAPRLPADDTPIRDASPAPRPWERRPIAPPVPRPYAAQDEAPETAEVQAQAKPRPRPPIAAPEPDRARPRPQPRAAQATPPARTSDEDTSSGPDLTRFLAASEPQPGDDEREPKQRKASKQPKAKSSGPLGFLRRHGRRIARWTITIGIVVAVALLLRGFVVAPVYIPSESMEPTLHGCANCNDDYVLVDKVSYRLHDPRRQDIVVFDKPANFKSNDDLLIKRVIATGGQTVQLRKGQVFVDGLKLSEPYVNPACGANPTLPLNGRASWKVPDGSLFVMGDNRCRSDDSRDFGPIPTSLVIGRAWLIFWPLKHFGSVG